MIGNGIDLHIVDEVKIDPVKTIDDRFKICCDTSGNIILSRVDRPFEAMVFHVVIISKGIGPKPGMIPKGILLNY